MQNTTSHILWKLKELSEDQRAHGPLHCTLLKSQTVNIDHAVITCNLNNKRVEDRYPVPQAIPMKDITTTSCCKALLSWISHFGLPLNITSDGGRQFIS